MAKTPKTDSIKQTKTTAGVLQMQRWNLWLAGIFAVVGFAVLLLSTAKTFPVQASYLTPDLVASEITGTVVSVMAGRHLFDINIAQLLAASCFTVALGQLVAATIYRRQYEADLKKRLNKVRWVTYGVSGGLAMVAVALLSGIAELSVLILLFLLMALVSVLGLALELQGPAQRGSRLLLYAAAGVVGAAPWLVIAGSFWATTVFGSGSIDGYVYWIFGTMLAMHLLLFVYTVRQMIRPGGASDYVRTEQTYMVLGAATMLLLVAQVFRGAL